MFFGHFGIASYGQQILNNLKHTGVVNLDKTTVTGKLEVIGELECVRATLHQVDVTGNCKFQDTTINSSTKICGLIKAVRTHFNSDTHFYANVNLDNSTATNIIFEKNEPNNSIQTLSLINSTINGDVTFKQGNGKIFLDSSSRITGNITGATLHNSNPSPRI